MPLKEDYPWIRLPLISSAPMRLVAGPTLAHAVSRAGGIGFIGAGNDISNLQDLIREAGQMQATSPISECPSHVLPIGIGILNWGVDLEKLAHVLENANVKPAAIWFFAPRNEIDLINWTSRIRVATGWKTKVWVQVGTVKSANQVCHSCTPDVLVIQGSDAGGHGLAQSSSIISLVPEICDALSSFPEIPLIAAGGIMDGRGVAAAVMLGAQGVCLGTRFLVSEEAQIAHGYKEAILAAEDGGVATVRSKVYDKLRGTTSWPEHYNARGVINKSYEDWEAGMEFDENKRLYDKATQIGDKGWGKDNGRMTTYAGTGVGLARKIEPAGEIVVEVILKANSLLSAQWTYLIE